MIRQTNKEQQHSKLNDPDAKKKRFTYSAGRVFELH